LLSSSSYSSSCTKERRSQIMTLVRQGQHTTLTTARRRSMRAGCHRRRPGIEDDLRRSTPSLRRPLGSIGGAICATYDARSKSRACVRTSVLPSFYALFDFFHVGIAMILQPYRWRSDSSHPRLNPIPTWGRRHRRRHRCHHRHRQRDSRLDVVLTLRSTHHTRPC
jgi:hypothetical protein